MLKSGTDKMLGARRRSKQIQKRNDQIEAFIHETFDYTRVKGNAALHRVLVQWVLDQVPLIEDEMDQS